MSVCVRINVLHAQKRRFLIAVGFRGQVFHWKDNREPAAQWQILGEAGRSLLPVGIRIVRGMLVKGRFLEALKVVLWKPHQWHEGNLSRLGHLAELFLRSRWSMESS